MKVNYIFLIIIGAFLGSLQSGSIYLSNSISQSKPWMRQFVFLLNILSVAFLVSLANVTPYSRIAPYIVSGAFSVFLSLPWLIRTLFTKETTRSGPIDK